MEEKFGKEWLKGHGVRLTPQRLELTKILKELRNNHPSFNEIYEAVKIKHPTVSRSTVYDNLKLLVELDLITSFHYKGETHYELNPDLHINLEEPGGRIKDIKSREVMKHLMEIERLIKEEEGVNIKSILILTG